MTANALRQCRGSADPGGLFLDCSSAAPGPQKPAGESDLDLASTLPAAQNESTAFSESLARSSAFAGDLENWVPCIPPSTR